MRSDRQYLLYQIVRFGVLTAKQMTRLSRGRSTRSSIYRAMTKLKEAELITFAHDPHGEIRAYSATPEGRATVLGDQTVLLPGSKPKEINHSVACTESLIRISQHENVVGIATSFELDANEVKLFCHERVPDGVFRLNQNGQIFDLALEVESTPRNISRVKGMLEAYWITFQSGMPCSGLVIAAGTKRIYEMYKNQIKEMPAAFSERVKIHHGIGFEDININAYGPLITSIPRSWDQSAMLSQGQLTFSPIESVPLTKQYTLIRTGRTQQESGGLYSK